MPFARPRALGYSGLGVSRLSRLPCLELCGLMLLGGCDGGGTCPDISAGTVTPTPLETRIERLSVTPNVVQLVVNDDGLYWRDDSSLYALPRGQSEPVLLYALPGATSEATAPATSDLRRALTGLLVDADHLYWSEGPFVTGVDAGFVLGSSPPGRVLSMPKAGGGVQVLLDSSDRSATAAGLDDTRVIVKLGGPDAGYYALDKLGGSVSALAAPAPFDTSRVVGEQIYWTDPSEENPQLYRAHFDATEPERLTRLEDNEFEVGPGYVLWRHEQTVTQPELLLDQNFMIWREGSGCVQALPGTGESISYSTARDAHHVYWHGFNALGSVSDSSDGSSPLQEMSLLRLDLQSGAIARLEAPGFHSFVGDQILGSDAQYLYLATADGLVAIATA